MDNNIFEDGDPWDHIMQMTANMEQLIKSHNDLVEEVLRHKNQITIQRAQIKEMKTVLLANGLYDQCIKK